MSSLRDIRRHLRSIENIKKITDAMERVAAARLRRAQLQAEQGRPYTLKMKEVVENIAGSEYCHPLFEPRPVKRSALIVIAADRGLSGSYNSNILHAAERFLKNYRKDQINLFLFGRKAVDFFKNKEWPIDYERIDWGGKISTHEIKIFSDQLVNGFLSEKFDEIWLIYTHYINVMHNQVVIEQFLHIPGKPPTQQKRIYNNYIFERSPEELIGGLLPLYCVTRLQTAFHEAYASELASRIIAMQTASKNSKELIEALTLKRNKLRQENITKELIEISIQ